MFSEEVPPPPKKQKVTKNALLSYLDKRSVSETSNRQEEFTLRREELQLQRERLAMEKAEVDRRWAAEQEDKQRRQQIDMKMIELLNSVIQKK